VSDAEEPLTVTTRETVFLPFFAFAVLRESKAFPDPDDGVAVAEGDAVGTGVAGGDVVDTGAGVGVGAVKFMAEGRYAMLVSSVPAFAPTTYVPVCCGLAVKCPVSSTVSEPRAVYTSGETEVIS
jgi:hypothetical protein